MSNLYKLKGGYKVKDFQLFRRTYPVLCSDELHTATYFIHREKVYSIDPETGKPSECNFGTNFLTTRYKHTFQPLDEFYEGAVNEDGELEVAEDDVSE